MPNLNISKVDTDPSKLVLVADYGWENSVRFNSQKRVEWHGEPSSQNLAFLDGHAKFTRLRKGLHVTSEYITIPFRDLAFEAADLQQAPGGE